MSKTLLFTILSAAGVAWLAADWYQYGHNTFLEHPQWEVVKAENAYAVIDGGDLCKVTRTALARNELRPSVWNGYQEIVFRELVTLEEIRFDFRLPAETEFTLLFDLSAEGSSGVRVSRVAPFPSAVLRLDPTRRFTQQRPIQASVDKALRADGWNRFRMVAEGQEYGVYVNDVQVARVERLALSAGRFGFRGGNEVKTAYCAIDNVRVRDAQGRDVVEEFHNTHHHLARLGTFLLITAGANCVVALLLRMAGNRGARSQESGGKSRRRHFFLIMLNGTAAVVLLISYAADYHWFSSQYPPVKLEAENSLAGTYYRLNLFNRVFIGKITTPEVIQDDSEQSLAYLEKERRRIGQSLVPYRGPRPDETRRILFLGGSQTFGEGASQRRATWVDRIGQLLGASSGPTRYECINAGARSAATGFFAKNYEQDWLSLRPDVVVFNFACNDEGEIDALRENLQRMLQLNRQRGVASLVILEPFHHYSYLPSHRIIAQVAQEEDVPVVDMPAKMKPAYDEGFLWWDAIHLTDAGQEQFARYLRVSGNS